jgi:hypothetical protein
MSDPLAIYLQDHLAGAAHAIDLVKNMREKYAGNALGEFASNMLLEIEEDRDVLRDIAARIGARSSELKEFGARVSEKVSRIKLSDEAHGFGTFESLEFLGLGIRGKRSLWVSLQLVAESDQRLNGVDFPPLIKRAERQELEVETQRLEIARTAFVNHS